MKCIPISLVAAVLTVASQAAEYSVFRVCEDQHVIRTSDGVEAGHVAYIVVDPTEHRIVSTVVSGGVVGERLVALPVDAMRFGADREIVLERIDRQRLVSAPVIERTEINTNAIIQPTVIERSYTHFGGRLDATATRTLTEVDVRTGADRQGRMKASTTTPPPGDATRIERSTPRSTTTTTPPDRESRKRSETDMPPTRTTRSDSDNPTHATEQPGRTSTGGVTATEQGEQRGRPDARARERGTSGETNAERSAGSEQGRGEGRHQGTKSESGERSRTSPESSERQKGESRGRGEQSDNGEKREKSEKSSRSDDEGSSRERSRSREL